METRSTPKVVTAIIFWVLILFAVVSRLLYFNPSIYSVSEDAAMVGLAALHWADGSDFPLMSYGQAYLGTLEAMTAALFFKLFGFGMSTLRLAPLVFALGFVVVVYLFGKEMGGKRFGLIAMAFAAIPAPYLAIWSVAVKGGYPETLFLGTLLLWLVWRLGQNKDKVLSYLWVGIVAGLAWWCHPLSIYYLIPSVIYVVFLLLKSFSWKSILGKSLAGGFGFLVGSFPFWIYNFQNHFLSFAGGSGFRWGHIKEGMGHFFSLAAPSIFYLKPVTEGLLGQFLCLIVIFLFIVSLFFLFKRPLFLLFGLTVFVLYSANQFGVQGETRYLLFLYSLIPFSLAWLCETFRHWHKLLGTFALVLILFHNSFILIQDATARNLRSQKDEVFIQETLSQLEEKKIDHVVTTFGPILSVMTQEKKISSHPRNGRFPKHELIVDSNDNVAFQHRVLERDLIPTFKGAGISYQMFKNPHSILYTDFQAANEKLKEIVPNSWVGTSPLAEETAGSAFDRNLAWTWTAAELKQPNQTYTLDLKKKEPVRLIRLYNGFGFTYFPAGLRVESSLNGKNWKTEANLKSLIPIYWEGKRPFWGGFHPRQEIRLSGKPIRYLRFVQLGHSSENIWKLNEIYLYRSLGKATPAGELDFQQLLQFLKEKKTQMVYAPRGLSAKIILDSKGEIQAPHPYNEKYPYATHTSRKIDFSKNWAFVFENEESPTSESLLKEQSLTYTKENLGPYTLFYGSSQNKIKESPYLMWSGFSIVKNGYQKPSEALAAKPTPQFPTQVRFNNKLEFLGYTLKPDPTSGSFQIRYYWKSLEPMNEDWSCFVHFEANGKIFQNDHALYHGEYPLKKWEPGQIVTETYHVSVPKDFPIEETKIYLGLMDMRNGKKRVSLSKSEVPTKGRRALIGTFNSSVR